MKPNVHVRPATSRRGPSRSVLWTSVLIALAVLASISGCTFIGIAREVSRGAQRGPALEVDAYEASAPRKKERFSAGVATVDITPPPGFPTGGHGPEGALPRGHWMRLRARAFFFEDLDGRTLTLVSADLFAIPAGLQAKVAEQVAAKAREHKLAVAFPPESFILAATHTHHSPGNYMTARTFNQFGSAYPGFSRPLFHFLTDRIATAVLEAIQDARNHPEPVELRVHVNDVSYDLVRNRSPRVFIINREREALLSALNGATPPPTCQPLPGEPRDGWEEIPGCPRLRAVDRMVTVLDVWRGGENSRRMGSLVFFAAHPTVLDPGAPLYTPDFVGYAVQRLEHEWATPSARPVVGFFNGAEGDITARRTRRDLLDTARLGLLFAGEIKAALEKTPLFVEAEPTITVSGALVKTGGREPVGCGEWTLAPHPMLGAAALGGAEGDRTALYQLGWKEGVVDRYLEGQGAKLPALDSRLVRAMRFSEMVGKPDAFPDTLPLARASIGGFELAALPMELSTAQGQAVRSALQRPHGRLELIGLANDYHSYCASPDEYSAQDYMGASTIWGPQQGPFLTCLLQQLGNGAGWPTRTKTDDRSFWPGNQADPAFGPSFSGARMLRPDEGLYEVLLDSQGLPHRHLPWFEWREPSGMCGSRLCPSPERRVAIWQRTDEGWRPLVVPPEGAEDDLGAGFLTILLESPDRWAAIWLRPLSVALQGTFAFVASPKEGEPQCSAPFVLSNGMPVKGAQVLPGRCGAGGVPTDAAAPAR